MQYDGERWHPWCTGRTITNLFPTRNIFYTYHVSPSNIIVPVPPFQHSPILGHCASSQTVCNCKFRNDSLTVLYRDVVVLLVWVDGAGTRNQDGRPNGISAPTLGRRNAVSSDVMESSSCVLSWTPILCDSNVGRCGIGTPPPPVDPSPRVETYDDVVVSISVVVSSIMSSGWYNPDLCCGW